MNSAWLNVQTSSFFLIDIFLEQKLKIERVVQKIPTLEILYEKCHKHVLSKENMKYIYDYPVEFLK